MSEKTEVSPNNGAAIKVGTTGTIGTLMSKELEAMKQKPQRSSSSSSQRKTQSRSVSLPCGFTSRKSQQKRNPSNEGDGSSNNRDADKPRYKSRRNGSGVPMLSSEDLSIEKNPSRDKKMDKKGRSKIAEVVDVKCNNPARSRLMKLGFSKLSASFS